MKRNVTHFLDHLVCLNRRRRIGNHVDQLYLWLEKSQVLYMVAKLMCFTQEIAVTNRKKRSFVYIPDVTDYCGKSCAGSICCLTARDACRGDHVLSYDTWSGFPGPRSNIRGDLPYTEWIMNIGFNFLNHLGFTVHTIKILISV